MPNAAIGLPSPRRMYEVRVNRDTAPSTNEISRKGAVVTRAALTAATPPATNRPIAKMACGAGVAGKEAHAQSADTKNGHRNGHRSPAEDPMDEPRASDHQDPDGCHGQVEDHRRRLEDDAVGRAGPTKVADLVAPGGEGVGVEGFGGDDPHQDRHAGDGEQCAAKTEVGRPGATGGGHPHRVRRKGVPLVVVMRWLPAAWSALRTLGCRPAQRPGTRASR